jgi:hypothetical protein
MFNLGTHASSVLKLEKVSESKIRLTVFFTGPLRDSIKEASRSNLFIPPQTTQGMLEAGLLQSRSTPGQAPYRDFRRAR